MLRMGVVGQILGAPHMMGAPQGAVCGWYWIPDLGKLGCRFFCGSLEGWAKAVAAAAPSLAALTVSFV